MDGGRWFSMVSPFKIVVTPFMSLERTTTTPICETKKLVAGSLLNIYLRYHMTTYKICWGTEEAVEKEVNELLAEGWLLQSGLAMHIDETGTARFAQALIKNEG